VHKTLFLPHPNHDVSFSQHLWRSDQHQQDATHPALFDTGIEAKNEFFACCFIALRIGASLT
jgi:hypothetical protein